MKRISMLACAVLLWTAQAYSQAIPRDPQVEAQVEQLLSGMSLEQKIGQMCELAIDLVAQRSSDDHVDSNQAAQSLAGGKLSKPAVENVFNNYYVGSILNVPEGLAQTPQAWSEIIRTLNQASAAACNGVPELYGVDQIHGASYTWGATLFPQEVSQGASFNTAIPYRIGQITAYESRACLIPWVYSPVMDVARSPLWPRLWESFGEDVLLNSDMAVALTLGLQGNDPNHIGANNVAACLKHYMAYGAAVSGKDRTPSSVTERELLEKYFQPFKACAEAGALSIMVNSANNNGMPFHCNHKLLTEWFKEGLDWDGMIVTDWADIDNLYKRDHVAASKKDAICLAINAGIDMTMDPYDVNFCTLLKELVEEGRVPQSRIDDAVRRILRLKIRVGLMDRTTWDIPYTSKKKKEVTLAKLYPDFGSEAFAQEAIHMAEECMVLLKNDEGLLPLRQGTRLFVCGPNADNFRPQNGGWTYTWQGHLTDSVARTIGRYKTFYQALADKFGHDHVTYSPLVEYDLNGSWQADHCLYKGDNRVAPLDIRKLTADCDVIIACIGENSYTETPGNIDDLRLSANQIEMVEMIAQAGKPILLILNEGRPRLITDIEPLAKGIVHTFLPGNYGGEALANLLAGEVDFTARMPYTYPKFHGAFSTYDSKPCENVATMEGAYNYDAKTDVLYTFGSGLSYTQVEYSHLTMDMQGEELIFHVQVTNHGRMATKEPVLLYVADLVASLTPDVRRLRSFTKVELQPGETKTVELKIRKNDLSFVNLDMQWVLEPGDFRAMIGNQSLVFTL